ncbi:MAG: HypC/HybG/HupF family hydrogenase formation chaperone [Candidatus Micrarchaeota archaeon]
MCLAIPSKVLKVDARAKKLLIDRMGERLEVEYALASAPKKGDFVLVQMGIAVSIIPEEKAKLSLKEWKKLYRSRKVAQPLHSKPAA